MSAVKTVLFNSGEGLSSDDLNDAQRAMQAQMFDVFWRYRLLRREFSLDNSATHCFVVGAGAYLTVTGTALRSGNGKGVVGQLVDTGAVDGDDPTVLFYHVAEDEIATTHDAAHATLDRWDIVCIKLEQVDGASESRDFKDATTGLLSSETLDKRRSVTLTKQVVKGSNATPGTAVEPSVPAGYVKWGALLIRAAHAGVFALSDLRAWTTPLGGYMVGVIIPSELASKNSGTNGFLGAWSTDNGGYYIASSAATQLMVAHLPVCPYGARVTRLKVRAKISSGGYIRLYRLTGITTTGGTATLIKDYGDTGGADTVTDLIDADGRIGGDTLLGPLWGRGSSGGPEDGNDNEMIAIWIESGASGDRIGLIQWELSLT
jgi:hypothetical protein